MGLLKLTARTLLMGMLLVMTVARADSFDLAQLSSQLSKPEVVRGNFVQEKYLRALPQPLASSGSFVLARGRGLLWLLREPVQQDYRISSSGIAQRDADSWQQSDQQGPAARQNDLFLAVLRGDTEALQRDFELDLNGAPQAWVLTLKPRSTFLKQIFSAIVIQGSVTAERVELLEAQGDSTLLTLSSITVNDQLSPRELHDLAN